MSRHIGRRVCLIVAIMVFAIVSVSAQELVSPRGQSVVYDWTSDAKTPESYPTIRRRQTVRFRIKNVNKILFTYHLEITQTPIADDDFSKLAGLFNLFRKGPASTSDDVCPDKKNNAKQAIHDAIEAINADTRLPIGYKTAPHVDVSLKDSVDAWQSHVDAVNTAILAIRDVESHCTVETDLKTLFDNFQDTVRKIDDKVKAAVADPDFVDDHVIDAGKDVSVTIVETYDSEVVKTKTFTFPGVDVLTLSAGALFSRIPDRSYEGRKVPGSTLNLLTVEGNSRATPEIAALLNYSLGDLYLDWDNFGLALSAGPVLRLGGQSDASSFGFFTGLSFHLRHRFFITPGFHFGQFADFPVGFGDRTPVPENFGELHPVKRWTTRFALALTFKAKDFSSLTGSDKPKVTGDEASGTTPPKPAPANSPAPKPAPSVLPPSGTGTETNADAANLSLSMRRDFLRPPSRTLLPPEPAPAPVAQPAPVPAFETPSQPVTAPETSAFDSRRNVATSAAAPITHVNSIDAAGAFAHGDRILLQAGRPIRDYAAYFRNGRFFLTIPRAQLDVIQDGLTGRTFTDPIFERRGEDLIVSFALLPGTKATLQEDANGIILIFLSAGTN